MPHQGSGGFLKLHFFISAGVSNAIKDLFYKRTFFGNHRQRARPQKTFWKCRLGQSRPRHGTFSGIFGWSFLLSRVRRTFSSFPSYWGRRMPNLFFWRLLLIREPYFCRGGILRLIFCMISLFHHQLISFVFLIYRSNLFSLE